MATINAFRGTRIFILLLILFFILASGWMKRQRNQDWESPVWVALYPINADGSAQSAAYIRALDRQHFQPIEEFFSRQATRYGVRLDSPLRYRLGAQVTQHPPEIPAQAQPWQIAWWSLKLRMWTWRHANYGAAADVHLFLRYFDPEQHDTLAHSFGLEKGMVGVVNLFASERMTGSNQMVIGHETLHTLGATDKYDLHTGQPIFPHGYAEPQLQPLFPQSRTELMGGRRPISETQALIPRSLGSVLIGQQTATEIKWPKLRE
jgi:hypothetical protein